MSRELKFRVWNKPAKCFVQDINNEIAAFTLLALSDYLKDNSISNIDHLIFQQYTGLKDKNNKPIYEGDFIRGMFDFGPAGYKEEMLPVVWDNEKGYQWDYWDLSTIEVILNNSVVNEAIAENKVHMLEKQLKEAQDRIKRLEKALGEIEAAMKRPASNHRLMQIAGPARQVIEIVKQVKEAKP